MSTMWLRSTRERRAQLRPRSANGVLHWGGTAAALVVVMVVVMMCSSAADALDCAPPPNRDGMYVAFGKNYVEYACRDVSYRLRCVNQRWIGYVPISCDPPTPRYTTPRPPPPPPPSPPVAPVQPVEPPYTLCGHPPHRGDMLLMVGYGGEFVDYYCKPPSGRPWQPVAYRLQCLHGRWVGHLPHECPLGAHSYGLA